MKKSVGLFLSHICSRTQNINIFLVILQQYIRIFKITHFKAASEQKQSDDLKTDCINLKKNAKRYFDVRRNLLIKQ